MPYRDLFERYKEPKKPKTNYERIKAMSVEEMAAWIIAVQYAPAKKEADKWGVELPSLIECIESDISTQIKWLESEVREDD